MFNIMDLASKYIPDFEKLTAGISRNYSKRDKSSSEDSFVPRRKNYKSKRPRKKKKKKVILIKKKLTIPEPDVQPKKTITVPRTKRTSRIASKWSAVPQMSSTFQNIRELKKGERKKPEKILRTMELKSESGQTGDVKKKVKVKKKSKPTVKTANMDKALVEFHRRKSQFMASLKLLQQHLSSLKTDQLINEPPKTASCDIKRQKKADVKPQTSQQSNKNLNEKKSLSASQLSKPCSKISLKQETPIKPPSKFDDFISKIKVLKKHGYLQNEKMQKSGHVPLTQYSPSINHNDRSTPKLLEYFGKIPIKKIPSNKIKQVPICRPCEGKMKVDFFRKYPINTKISETAKEFNAGDALFLNKPSLEMKFDEKIDITSMEDVVRSMKSMLPKCTVYRGRQ